MSQTTIVEDMVGGLAPSSADTAYVSNPGDPFGAEAPNVGGASGQTGAPAAVDFMQIARMSTYATAMSSEGNKYVSELKAYLEERGSSLSKKVKVISLAYPPETLAVMSGSDVFILLFSEAVRKEDNIPTVSFARHAMKSLQAVVGENVRMRNCIVVTPSDYSKATIMGAHLLNAFKVLSSPEAQSMTIESLKNYFIDINTSKSVHDDFIRRYDPHGTPARADFYATIGFSSSRKTFNGQTLFDQVETDKIDVAAISAYVTFVQSQGPMDSYVKYVPEIHISNIVTSVMFDGLIPVLLALATKTFLDEGYWKSQFSDLGSKGIRPNIGNLLLDTNSAKPFHVDNIPQREDLIRAHCEPPVIVLDIVEGRARIPGIELYALPEASYRVVETYTKFLGAELVLPASCVPLTPITREYIGTFQSGSATMDSRWCDFLNLVAHHPTQWQQMKALMAHYQREDDMSNLIKQYVPDLTLHYVNHVVMPSPDVVRSIQNVVVSKLRVINGQAVSGMTDISSLLNAGRSYQSSPQGVYYTMQQNPFAQIYGPSSYQKTMF